MQIVRRRDGEVYILEAYSKDQRVLEALRKQWRGAYIQWERDGVPVTGEHGGVVSSGPAYVLWRPELAAPPRDELEDLADLLAAPLEAPVLDDPPPAAAASDPPPAAPPAPAEQPPAPPTAVVFAPISPSEAMRPTAIATPHSVPRPRALQKNITRVDHAPKSTYGYMVRVRWKGETHQHFFADKQYGGQGGALAAAIVWRDQKEREIGKPRSEALVIGKGKSNTGIIGVTRTVAGGDPVFQVTWYEDGRQRRKKFNIRRLGEAAALRQAAAARAEAESERLARTSSPAT